jgi:hypothetical protein
MKNSKNTNCNPLPDEVKINLNVFREIMLNRVGSHVDSADIVTIITSVARLRGARNF